MNVVIVGGGAVGTYLASLLLQRNHHVTLIEQRDEEIPRLQRELTAPRVMCGNGTDPDVLERADIRHANVLAAVTGADEINLVATSLARFEFRVPRTIARVHTPQNVTQCVLTAIIRGGQLLLPHQDVIVQSGDEVLAVAHASALPQLAALLGRPG